MLVGHPKCVIVLDIMEHRNVVRTGRSDRRHNPQRAWAFYEFPQCKAVASCLTHITMTFKSHYCLDSQNNCYWSTESRYRSNHTPREITQMRDESKPLFAHYTGYPTRKDSNFLTSHGSMPNFWKLTLHFHQILTSRAMAYRQWLLHRRLAMSEYIKNVFASIT